MTGNMKVTLVNLYNLNTYTQQFEYVFYQKEQGVLNKDLRKFSIDMKGNEKYMSIDTSNYI